MNLKPKRDRYIHSIPGLSSYERINSACSHGVNILYTFMKTPTVNPMFTLGLRAPLNSEHTLFLDIHFDFAVPRNRINDEPPDMAALYEWNSFSLGICYYLSGIIPDHN